LGRAFYFGRGESVAEGRVVARVGEALVLRTWPFHEADLLVSLFTREHGKVKGIARHAMRSRRRFGGALEPMTHVRASWAERPKQDLVRLDAFEIMSSPLTGEIDYARVAALELVAEVLDELPEGAVEDAVFRLALAVLAELQVGRMPELGRCVVCGLAFEGGGSYYSETADGMTCADDRRPGSVALSAASTAEAVRMFRGTVGTLAGESWPKMRGVELRRFAIATLERHLEKRLMTARALGRA